MPRIADNILKIRERIHAFEQRYQRPDGAVTLLAVSKKQTAEAIRDAYEAGIRDFGENYLQEAEGKISALSDLAINWHFIGPIQSNKTRLIAELFSWVHSVDRVKVARRLSEQRDPSQPALNICVQVNLSGEASKSGVMLADTESLCQQIEALEHLNLRGLMAIPAPQDDFEQQRQVFHELADLFNRLNGQFSRFDTLSMGMSGDYEAAIAEGSTLVRIGTALFGARV
ncbi:MAG: YggS family pyridoxal phosphate-dependent enzyme [Gammaproteobacteria bacterium]|nr:YggS family pyridoxal phosphate-dependent enzyme [Gammaproteobacteria bacterium]